jgi:hypothetical protein
MSREHDLDARYLEALTEIAKSLRHGMRGVVGNLKLQVNLIGEFVKLRQPGDAEAWAKIQAASAKASKFADELVTRYEQALASIRLAKDADAPMDLRGVIRDVEGLLAYYVKDIRQSTLEVHLPKQPVALEGSRDVIQRALLVVLLEASRTLEPPETLELRLDDDGVLEVRGAAAHRWLPRVTDILELIGGGLDVGPQGSIVAIRLPIQTRI